MVTYGSNPHVDDQAWMEALLFRQGGSMAMPVNEFLEVCHAQVPVTNSLASYEKSIRLTEVITHDPSDYGNGITRDACGDDSRCTIAAGNLTGRGWGAYSDVVIEPGGDGLAIAKELSLFNDGTDQPAVDTATSKYGLLITPKGSQPSTAAVYVIGKIHQGFVMRQDSFPSASDSFLVLYRQGTNDPLFRVDSMGNLTHAFGRPVVVKQILGSDVLTLG